ncbi:MAG: glycoside hydrolase family 20 zincin-like fold domain-containing protein, partial [Chitinophagaceae bacterium]
MKKFPLAIIMAIITAVSFAQTTTSIIPRPVSLKMGEGIFKIDRNTSIQYDPAQKTLRNAADFMAAHISQVSAYNLPVNGKKANDITLKL